MRRLNIFFRIFVLPLVILLANSVSAQGVNDIWGNDLVKPAPSFDVFAKFIKENSAVDLKYPKDYTLIESRMSNWRPDMTTEKNRLLAHCYRYLFASADRSHLILYPMLDIPRSQSMGFDESYKVMSEVNESLTMAGEQPIKRGFKIDIEDKSGAIDKFETAMKDYLVEADFNLLAKLMNADKVLVTKFKLTEPYKGQYEYCTAIYAFKAKQVAIFVKCFFKEDSAIERNKALEVVASHIKYSKKALDESDKAKELRKDRYVDFHKKYETGGVR